MNKITFEFDGRKIDVRRPKPAEETKAQAIFNKKFNEALTSGAILRDALIDNMTKQGLWNSEIEKTIESLKESINKKRDIIKKGGIKKTEAYKIALDIKDEIARLNFLNRNVNKLDKITADSQAEQARFEYYVSVCTVDAKNGEPIYKSLEDYLTKANDVDDKLTYLASLNTMYLLSGVDPDAEGQTEENKFLRKFKYVDEKLRLVDKDGRLINSEGRHVDEIGRLIKWNEDFTKFDFVDWDGNIITENGEPVIEEKPFLDDDEKPIID